MVSFFCISKCMFFFAAVFTQDIPYANMKDQHRAVSTCSTRVRLRKLLHDYLFHELKIADGKVDIIHGHSPHHVLPVEEYEGGYIFYSVGDLIDDYAIDDYYRNDLGCITDITIDTKTKRIMNYKIHPTRIYHIKKDVFYFQVNLLKDREKEYDLIIKKMKTSLHVDPINYRTVNLYKKYNNQLDIKSKNSNGYFSRCVKETSVSKIFPKENLAQ